MQMVLYWELIMNGEQENCKKNLLSIEEGKPTTPINSKLVEQHNSLAEIFSDINRKNYSQITLNFLLKKINLTEPIK